MSDTKKTPKTKTKEKNKNQFLKKSNFFQRRSRFNLNFSAEDVDHIHNQLFERNYY